MSFQKNTMTIAVIVFILILTMIGFLLSSSNKNASFPPEIAQCPDYYKGYVDQDGKTHCEMIDTVTCQDLGFTGPAIQNNCEQSYVYDKNATPVDKCNEIKKGIDYVSWPGISDRNLC